MTARSHQMPAERVPKPPPPAVPGALPNGKGSPVDLAMVLPPARESAGAPGALEAEDLALRERVNRHSERIRQAVFRRKTGQLRKLNDAYALVLLGDRAAVLHETVGPDGTRAASFLSMAAFHEWLRPLTYYVLERDENRSLSKLWVQWPDRRQYAGVVFDPSGTTPPSYYNLWRGFPVQPDPRGERKCRRLIEHIAENVCCGDERLFNWVMGWFAQMVQEPTEKLGTSLVLRGPQGAGKSFVGTTIGSLLRPHYALIAEARYLVGRFNSHLASCLLLQLDEATWGGDHAAAGKLRDLITGDWQHIEYKGKEPVPVRNYLRLLVTGNNRWLVPAGLDERRFAVLDVGDRRARDHAYFAKIREELENGGRGALLHYLQTYDYSDVPLRQIPETAALAEQKLASLTAEQKWWLDILSSGQLPGDRLGTGETRCAHLQQHYVEHLQRMGVSRRSSETELGTWLRSAAPGLTKKRGSVQTAAKVERPYVYSFPPLSMCRRVFDRLIGHEGDFDEIVSEWQPGNEAPS